MPPISCSSSIYPRAHYKCYYFSVCTKAWKRNNNYNLLTTACHQHTSPASDLVIPTYMCYTLATLNNYFSNTPLIPEVNNLFLFCIYSYEQISSLPFFPPSLQMPSILRSDISEFLGSEVTLSLTISNIKKKITNNSLKILFVHSTTTARTKMFIFSHLLVNGWLLSWKMEINTTYIYYLYHSLKKCLSLQW